MGRKIKEIWMQDIWLRILSIVSVLLLIAGFIVPPLGVVDGSVLIGISEIGFFGCLFEISKGIDSGVGIKASKGDTSIEVEKNERN